MKPVILACLCLFIGLTAFAQTDKIALWSGPAPGTENRENAEQTEPGGSIVRVHQPQLTFFPAPNQSAPAPAILVCPGGGYRSVVMPKEGVRVAEFFQKRGFAVFVLKYRLHPDEALQDARRAMRVIRAQAERFKINPDQLGVMGFSAGGHLSANLALNFAPSDLRDETDRLSARPDFCAPVYAVLKPLNPATFQPDRFPALRDIPTLAEAVKKGIPPMFLTHAADDEKVPAEQSLQFYKDLKAKGVPAELHIYEKGGHGFALETARSYAASWGDAFVLWLKARGIEPKPIAN